VHGSYASASPTFVQNSKFCHLLKRLLPGAYDELKSLMKSSASAAVYSSSNYDRGNSGARLDSSVDGGYSRAHSEFLTNNKVSLMKRPDPVKVMKWAENNPVVSAFGIWESDSGRRTVRYPTAARMSSVVDCYSDTLNTAADPTTKDAEFIDADTATTRQIKTDEFATGAQNAKSAFLRRRPPPSRSFSQSDTTYEIRPSHNKPALEWDVFVDPKLVRQVSAALEVVEGLEWKINMARNKRMKSLLASQRQNSNNSTLNTTASYDESEEEYDLYQSHTAAQIEVDRLVTQLMKRMILAHGSMSQLVLEAFGVAKDYNYKSVVKGVREMHTPERMRGGINGNSRRGGNELVFWDKAEEERDFDSLLHPDHMSDNGMKKKGSSFVGSRGIFMENWLSIFSQTLVLLKNNSDSDKLFDKARRRKETNLRIETTQPAQIGQSEGLGGLLHRIFARKNSSFALTSPMPVEGLDDDSENDTRDDDYDTTSDCATSEVGMPSLMDMSPRSNDSDAYDDMFATPKAPTSSLGALCGMSLCLTGDDSPPSATHDLHYASHNMSRDIQRISDALGEPLRLVLDLKSRRVPPKVWSRLIDSMRSRGLVVEGIGSFDMDELRVIAKSCSCPLTPILFFHSVGDLQRACHANEVCSDLDYVSLRTCKPVLTFIRNLGQERGHCLLQRRLTNVETINNNGSSRTRMLRLQRYASYRR
jgi:hypothetical protein